jgi:uncharacterized protein (TIGR04255 family)
LNDTENYTWVDFRQRSIKAYETLIAAYPRPEKLKIISMDLRYIDAIEFDYSQNNIYHFMRDKLKIGITIPDNLFQGTNVSNTPNSFVCDSSFKTTRPDGTVRIRFSTGKVIDKLALVWETRIRSKNQLPTNSTEFQVWIDSAHAITDDWFFKLIEGELEKRFE